MAHREVFLSMVEQFFHAGKTKQPPIWLAAILDDTTSLPPATCRLPPTARHLPPVPCPRPSHFFLLHHNPSRCPRGGDHFLRDFVRHVVVMRKLHRVAGASLRHRCEARRVIQHLCTPHLRLDHHARTARLASADPSAPRT